jgi:tetratricopeptide (TPR) repeat protein
MLAWPPVTAAPDPSPAILFEQGLAEHQAGRIGAARKAYEAALARAPGFFDALHMLGVARVQSGEVEQGAALIEQALKLQPRNAAAHVNLAMALAALGRQAASLEAADRALALDPASVEAHVNRGNALLAMGRYAEALGAYDAVLARRPADPQAHYNRANALGGLGRLEEAVAGYDAAISLRPGYLEALCNRAAALLRLGRLDEALSSCDAAIAAHPRSAEAHSNRAGVLSDLKRPGDALAAADIALSLKADYADAHSNRAGALNDLNRPHDALAAADRALLLRSDHAEAHVNRGVALYALRRLPEAIAALDRAIALSPTSAEARLNRGVAHLLAGDLAAGFADYAWRWKLGGAARSKPRADVRDWEGEALDGKQVLVFGEQGYGDCLQFVRYVPCLKNVAAGVTLLAEPALLRLFRASLPGVDVTDRLPEGDELRGGYDVQVAMLCLPRVFATTLETIPAETPYLTFDPAAAARWAARLAALPEGPKVGLCWAGDARRHNPVLAAMDARRSLKLRQLAPLVAAPEARFVSLQVGEAAAEAREPPPGLSLVDWASDLGDFADTAALIAGLDLVITVDTAVAHLAGALGRPVWILSRHDGCWRWLEGRDDSPWYPTARLFRQASPGDWDDVIARLAAALAHSGR